MESSILLRVLKKSVDFIYKFNRNIYICFTITIEMSKSLGEFEELILTFVAILGDQAYGNAILEAIKENLGREVNLSATHITLYRLEDKGLVKSSLGGATATRGGRRKRYFQITSAGKNRLLNLQQQRQKMWNLLPKLNFQV